MEVATESTVVEQSRAQGPRSETQLKVPPPSNAGNVSDIVSTDTLSTSLDGHEAHSAMKLLASDQLGKQGELGISEKGTSHDSRIDKIHRHYEETYSLADETTPEGAKLVEIAHKLEGEEFRGKIKYRIINHPELNAFALGDTVYIFSGLLSRLQTTSEVASVLAHEITHIEGGDTTIHDSTNDPDSVHEAIANLSVPRIQEYTADAMVAERLDAAGYNPTSYQRVLDMFHNLPTKGVDFAHGFAKDRQSAQLLQMKLKDYESTSREDNGHKPTELTEAYLAPNYKPYLFDELYQLSESGRSDEATLAEIHKLSPLAILDFHSYLGSRMAKLFDEAIEARRSPSVPDIVKTTSLMSLTDREVDRRINQAFPQISSKEAYWLRIVLYTEVQDRKFGELQEPADTLQRSGGRGYASSIDYAGRLVSTFNTEDDVVAFAWLAKNHDMIQQLGYDVVSKDFPQRAFSLFPETWQFTSKDMFFGSALRKLHPDPTRYSSAFDFVEKVGAALGSDLETPGAGWTSQMLDRVKTDAQRHYVAQLQRLNPRLYDQDTPQAVIQYAPQIKPDLIKLNQEFFSRAEKYWEPAYREEHKKSELRMMAGALYSKLPYEMQDQYEQDFVVEYLRAEDPKLDKMLQLADAKDSRGLISFLQADGVESFIKYSSIAKLSERDIDFAYQILREAQDFIQNEYTSTEQDRRFILDLTRSSKLLTPELQTLSAKYKDVDLTTIPVDQLLREFGIGDREIKTLMQIRLSRQLTIGGNEDRAYGEYEQAVNSIDLSKLSPNAAMIIFNQLISYGEAGGHGLAHYKERHYELDWGKVLRTSNFIALRDKYFTAWQTSDAPLRERIKQVRALSDHLTEFGNKQTREPDANWFGSNQEVATFVSSLVENVMGEMSKLEINRGSIEDLQMLHELVGVLDDRRLASRLRSELELQIVKLMVFDEATTYIKDLLDKNGFPIKAIDWYQENLIKTSQQLQRAQTLMDEYFDKVHSRGDERVTAAAGIDYAFENFFTEHSLEVFEAALESQHDDSKLQTLLAKFWYSTYMPTMTTPYRLDIPTVRNGLTEVKITGGAQHQFVPFETFVQGFYQKLGQTEIDILLRKMLISREGVLMTPEGRGKLHGLLMRQISSGPQDANLRDLIDQIVGTGLEVVDPAKLYQPIASILREKMFLAPPKPGSNQGAVEYVWREYTSRLQRSLESRRDSVSRAETTYDRQRKTAEYEEYRRWIADNTPTQVDMGKVLEFNPLITREGISDALRAIEGAKNRLTELVGLPEREVKAEQMEPVEVILEFSRNMGAVGVRFLQLLGQYVDLPERYQAKFDEVYDQIRGQLKYTAYQTLRREATKEGASTELRSFWQNMHSLSPTIAGGSLMTVYRAQMNDGSEKIVKILNPNAEEFVRQNIADAKAVVARMQARNPSAEYELAATLIKDLEEWLVEDINTTSYEQNNAVFESVNNGFSVRTTNGQQVTIASPVTIQTGTKYVKIEDVVEGRNLSEVLNQEGPEAARPYVEATIASFKHQTETPAADGEARVHSDVHIGNVRIGNDGKLYWIDRGYYLEMPTQEVAIIKPLLEGQFDPMIGMQAIGYLLGLPENQGLSASLDMNQLFGAIIDSVTEATGEGQSKLMIANNVLLTLKKRGIHIPIRFSLFFKNVRAQAKMAERVGVPYP